MTSLFSFIPTTPYCPPGAPPPPVGAHISMLGCLGTSAPLIVRVTASVSLLHFLNQELIAHFPGKKTEAY